MKPPKRLKNDARKKWVEVFTTLNSDNPLDIDLACQYCELADTYARAQKEIEAATELTITIGTNGTQQPIAAVNVLLKTQTAMERIWKKLAPKLKADAKEETFDELDGE
jgi:phage terminase small subunit